MKHAILALVFFFVLVVSSHAKPRNAKEGETQFLENADRYIREGPVALKPASTPTPAAKQTPSPTPRFVTPASDEEEEESAEKTILGHSKKVHASPPAVIHDSKIFIGQEVPFPKDYSAPVIRHDANGFPIVTPSQPRSFESRPVGVSMQNNNPGQSVQITELEGFVNYGNPIQTVVPVYNEKGEVIGTRVISVPNNILQPVFKSYRQER